MLFCCQNCSSDLKIFVNLRLYHFLCFFRGRRRLHAIAAAPLYLLSIISNMYFLIGLEAGDIFLKRGFNSWPWGTPLTLFFMYCGSQVSIEMKNWEIWKELAKLSDEHTN